MRVIRLVRKAYLGFTIYVLLVADVTTLSAMDILPAVILMWVLYALFSAGARSRALIADGSTDGPIAGWLTNARPTSLAALAAVSFLFSVLSVHYYTGQWPIEVVDRLLRGDSLYASYQEHFREESIGVLSLAKLPFVFMLFALKFMVYYSVTTLLCNGISLQLRQRAYVFLSSLSLLYFGIARGTSFEVFELAALVFFAMLSRGNGRIASTKDLVFATVIFASALAFFIGSLTVRSGGHSSFDGAISADVQFNPDGIVSSSLPMLAAVVVHLFSYMGFGFFSASVLIVEIWLGSWVNLVSGLIPFGFQAVLNESVRQLLRNSIDMGARWVPDVALWIGTLGVPGLMVACYLLGRVSARISAQKNSGLKQLTLFLIFLQMISLPVGNFLTASTSNVLILLTVALLWIKRYVRLSHLMKSGL